MATFTVIGENLFHSCNTKVPELSEIFVQRKFSAIQYMHICAKTSLPLSQSCRLYNMRKHTEIGTLLQQEGTITHTHVHVALL